MMMEYLRQILAANEAAHAAIQEYERRRAPRCVNEVCNPPRFNPWPDVRRKRRAIWAAMRTQWTDMARSGNWRLAEFTGLALPVLWSLSRMMVAATLHCLHVVNVIELRRDCDRVRVFCG